MKKRYLLLLVILIPLEIFSQQCNTLGCAKKYSTQKATGKTLAFATNLGCINHVGTRQAFWQFLYSPSGGNYTQVFTPTGSHDLDWCVFDSGKISPAITCPVSTIGWRSVSCNNASKGNWNFTKGTPQIGGNNLTNINCIGALPITILNFKGYVNQAGTYTLNWKTAKEINTSHFIIEYSHDGINWNGDGRVAANDSSGVNNYSFYGINQFNGTIYFRLEIADKDSSVSYTNVIVLKFSTVDDNGLTSMSNAFSKTVSCNAVVASTEKNAFTNIYVS